MTDIKTAVAEIIEAFTTGALSSKTLVERAGHILTTPAEQPDSTVVFESGVQEQTVNELCARAAELADIIKAATKERDSIKDILRTTLGDNEVLSLHTSRNVVFTNKRIVTRALDQSWIKSRYPDIEGNEDFYRTTESRRADFK